MEHFYTYILMIKKQSLFIQNKLPPKTFIFLLSCPIFDQYDSTLTFSSGLYDLYKVHSRLRLLFNKELSFHFHFQNIFSIYHFFYKNLYHFSSFNIIFIYMNFFYNRVKTFYNIFHNMFLFYLYYF